MKEQEKDIMHEGAVTGEHIDLSLACSRKTNLLALIVMLLFFSSSLYDRPSVCPSPSWKGPGKYKQDAVMSDRKSPLVCSLACSPGPRPFPSSPRHPNSRPDPLLLAQKRKPSVSVCTCICVICVRVHREWLSNILLPNSGVGNVVVGWFCNY